MQIKSINNTHPVLCQLLSDVQKIKKCNALSLYIYDKSMSFHIFETSFESLFLLLLPEDKFSYTKL